MQPGFFNRRSVVVKKTIIIGLLLVLAACGGQSTPAPTPLATTDGADASLPTAETTILPESTVDPERTADVTAEAGLTLEVTPDVTAEEALLNTEGETILVDEIANNVAQTTEDPAATQDEDAATDSQPTAEATEAGEVVKGQSPADICAANVPASDPATREYAEPQQVLEEGVDYRAVFCTDAGTIYVDLFELYSPITVNNFVFLANNDYYNNTIFHRVIQDFMAQGGDPTGTGSGGPGYQFQDEFAGFLTFDHPGVLAMANVNRPEQGIVGTNGSQFFITTVPTDHLHYRHTIFGEVLEGQDIVDAIQIRDPEQSDSPATQLQTVVIVTDPATVASSYEPAAPASAEEILAAFDEFRAVAPTDLNLTMSEQIEDIDATIGAVPETIQPDYRDFLTANNFEYSVSSSINNEACNLQNYVFTSAGYQLLAFATQEDAAAALNSDFLAQLAEAEGYAPSDLTTFGQPVYVRTDQLCNVETRGGLAFVQRGRFIAVMHASIPTGNSFDVDLVLDQLVARNYEVSLSDVLRREVTK
jgi:cyclophilin family peptidyl-prolyl cis-trans isomerase